MPYTADDARHAITQPAGLWTRDEVLGRPSPVPREAGVYGWYFRQPPCDIDVSGCVVSNGLTLLYVGISPREPSKVTRAPSQETLRRRLRTHYDGRADRSTLRLTLGVLLGLPLQLTSSGRSTFGDAERQLGEWMGRNAFVTWAATPEPWIVEQELIHSCDLPLNLRDNDTHPFRPVLSELRREAKRHARSQTASDSQGSLPAPGDVSSVSRPLRFAGT